MLFRYEKLYVDVVTADGAVCVAYATWLKIAGLAFSSAGYETYGVDGSRAVVHATGAIEMDREHDGRVSLRFATDRGPWTMTLQSGPGGRSPPHRLTPHLSWQVLVARGEARTEGGGNASFHGLGYSDWVEMTRPPRLLGLRALQWGRGHIARDSFVFTQAEFKDRNAFRVALINGEQTFDLALRRTSDRTLEVQAAGTAVSLHQE